MTGSLFASIGTIDNLNDPTPFFNHAESMYGIAITCLVIMTICTCFRLYVRFFVTCCPGLDDAFIILLFASTWISTIGSLLLVNVGLGKHLVLLGDDGIKNFSQVFWWSNAAYNMALAFVKLSLLTQYLRLFQEHAHLALMKKRRHLTIGLIIATSIWGLTYSFLAWVPCVPISGLWNTTEKAVRYAYGSQDVNTFVNTYISQATLNMALDIAVLSIPVSTWGMWNEEEVGKKARKALIGLYVIGGIAMICSIARFAVVIHTRASTKPEFDPSWYGATAIGLSIIEVNVATIVAALPVFWPHLRKNLDKILITREVEVRVTGSSGFNQLESNDDTTTKRRTQWPTNFTKSTPATTEVVAMTNFNKGSDRGTEIIQREFDEIRLDSRASTKSHTRLKSSFSVSSMSKEILIKKT